MASLFKKKPVLLLLSVAVYAAVFVLMHLLFGHAMAIASVIPAVAAGWLYGLWYGVVVGVLTFPVNCLMCAAVGVDWVDRIIIKGGFIGTVAVVLIGAVVGRIRDLSSRLRTELVSRQQAEQELKQHRDNLEHMIEQRTAELQRTTYKLENLIASSLDPIVICDNEGIVESANNAFYTLTGYSKDEVIGMPIYSFTIAEAGGYTASTGEHIAIEGTYFDEKALYMQELSRAGTISNWQTYSRRKDGIIVPIRINIVGLFDDDRSKAGSFAIIRDITEDRKSELSLIKAKNDAEEANHAKSRFLANMSHEIRTPMNGVVGFTDMLFETKLDPEQYEYAQTIKQSGEALLSLINDILDFSKIEAGKVHLEKIDFDLEVLAYDVCDMIRPRLAGKEIELMCRVGDDVPAQVNGDPHRFRQVLINLLGNAVKFTDDGEIELSVDVREQREHSIVVHAAVRDTGVGIPESKRELVFEVFQQSDSSTTRQYGGTGLGLSISKKIAELMGGALYVESSEGRGSTFHFTAELSLAAARAVDRCAAVALSGKKVLMTDDNPTNLGILENILKTEGMQVSGFRTAQKALEAVKSASSSGDPFDICVLDVHMPGMSGFDLARSIRDTVSKTIPLLAFTSSTSAGGARQCEDAGFNGFLPKPVKRIRLLKMMERLIGEAGSGAQSAALKREIVTQHSMREEAKYSSCILMAEDNPVNQKLAVKLLEKAGYRVVVAQNGRQAVDAFRADPDAYDIIFMDIQMPELNGYDATRELRAQGFTRVPIVAMTANALKGDREKCLAAGMDDYISKPIKREKVFDVLKNLVFERPLAEADTYCQTV